MELEFTADETVFRDEVRNFIETEMPKDVAFKMAHDRELEKEDFIKVHRKLYEKGWATAHWPKEYGGADWTPVQRHIFGEEMQRASLPMPLEFNANMVGPVIAHFGSKEQKEKFLQPTASLEIWWGQGFSEPGAGSDLASLKTTAVRDGNEYIINGQKTWTTLGHFADWIFCLVRTDPSAKKQKGISFILVDMKTPGIEVRPIITVEGNHEVNEVFFDNVRVPAENLVGEENRGWDYAKFLLSNERFGIAKIGVAKQRMQRIKSYAQTPDANGEKLWDDAVFRARFLQTAADIKALEITQLRILAKQQGHDSDAPDPLTSMLKIKGSELQQATTELLLEVAGKDSESPQIREIYKSGNQDFEWLDAVASSYFNNRKLSIYGGSNEIQHNILSKAIMGF